MSEKNRPDTCRVCNSHLSANILSDIKTTLGEVYKLRQCTECSFISTDPLPSPDTLKRYYDKDYWQRYNSKTGGLLTLLFSIRMSGIINNLKKMVHQRKCILDWGAGDGSLIRLLDKNGFESYGIDIYSTDPANNKLISTTIENAPFENEFFDAITCFHVLEHIDRPVPALTKAFSLLKPGGIIVVEVPNIDSLGFRIFKSKWYPLDIPVHLNHFNSLAINKLFNRAGKSKIIKVEHFSHRHSPSSLLLSLLPLLSPPRIRDSYSGNYPLPLMILYMIMQLIIYPFSIFGALINEGEVIRLYARKTA